jgi:molybdate transport system substrate-binding protein
VKVLRRALAVALVPLAGACGGSTAHGRVTVFAAASLTEAFHDEQARLAGADPGLHLSFDFAGSQALVSQIRQGAPADVLAAADQRTMQTLVAAGLVEPPVTFARNRLEIAVAPGNPRHVGGLADLARPGLTVVLDDPSVPAGRYSAQVLRRAGVTVHPASRELDVKAALAKVVSGEADATIVYATDVRAAGARVAGVPIPVGQNVVASYPVAVVRASRHRAAARAFVAWLTSPAGRAVLRAHGFVA